MLHSGDRMQTAAAESTQASNTCHTQISGNSIVCPHAGTSTHIGQARGLNGPYKPRRAICTLQAYPQTHGLSSGVLGESVEKVSCIS